MQCGIVANFSMRVLVLIGINFWKNDYIQRYKHFRMTLSRIISCDEHRNTISFDYTSDVKQAQFDFFCFFHHNFLQKKKFTKTAKKAFNVHTFTPMHNRHLKTLKFLALMHGQPLTDDSILLSNI